MNGNHTNRNEEAHMEDGPPPKWWHTYDHPLTEEDALKKYGVWNDILRTHVIPRFHQQEKSTFLRARINPIPQCVTPKNAVQ
jgi:hypothetical protein